MWSSEAKRQATRTRKVHIPRATAPQRQFWQNVAQFRLFRGGIGSGKTFAGAIEVLRQPANSVGMVLAPTYPMLRDASLRTFLGLARPLVAEFNTSTMTMTLTNGTTVLWRSADNPDRLRGPNLGWFWLDEAGQMTREAWLIMLGRLRKQPARAWVTTTPNGKNWLYDVFEAAAEKNYATVVSSSRDNVYNPAGFVQTLESAYTSEFAQQEIEGNYVDPAGALFQRHWFNVVDHAPDGLDWVRYWDLAVSTKSSADYTASAAAALADDGTLYIRDVIHGRWEWPDQRRIIVNAMRAEPDVRYGIEEALHGIAAIQELQRDSSVAHVYLQGVRVDRDKVSRALPWAARAERGKVALVRGEWINGFLDELAQFPRGAHDDQVDAVSGAVGMIGDGSKLFVFGGG